MEMTEGMQNYVDRVARLKELEAGKSEEEDTEQLRFELDVIWFTKLTMAEKLRYEGVVKNRFRAEPGEPAPKEEVAKSTPK